MQQTGSFIIIKHIGQTPSSAIYLYRVKSSFNNWPKSRFGNAGLGYFVNKVNYDAINTFKFKIIFLVS